MLVASCLLLVLGSAPVAPSKKANGTEFKRIDVAQLVAQRAAHPETVVLDANGPSFRAKHGVIPGARLLSSFNDYDVAKELPADRDTPLVFYCANHL